MPTTQCLHTWQGGGGRRWTIAGDHELALHVTDPSRLQKYYSQSTTTVDPTLVPYSSYHKSHFNQIHAG